ncbi:hypothetical protein BJ508DRAFT_413358 [Ascobolus immersus RN42]|uniref:RING-type domain-containing protein n=1 Tax=Ascobolus immersus RN42 TaxID=1160509 RepID=A0A3N4IE02_ASCIM|nr:hypothetical protein BJ508DRAFT_413358 [Ascobolus immersus RN42]
MSSRSETSQSTLGNSETPPHVEPSENPPPHAEPSENPSTALDPEATTAKTPLRVLDILKSHLECPICGSIVHEPVSLLPCIHSFCGACISPWIRKTPTCPSCRELVRDTRHDYKVKELASIYLKERPDEQRTEEDIKEMAAVYKSGDKIPFRANWDPEDPEDSDDEDYVPPPQFWEACRWCLPPVDGTDPHRPPGFTCPHPLPLPGTSTIRRTEYHTLRQEAYPEAVRLSHIVCQACLKPAPNAPNAAACCGLCQTGYCNNIFGDCVAGEVLTRMDMDWDTWRLEKLGAPENELLTKYLEDNSLVLRTELAAWLDEDETRISLPDAFVNPGRSIIQVLRDNALGCLGCRKFGALFAHLESWWKYVKMTKGVRDDRDKCWYGDGCRTRAHNHQHRDRLNHMCDARPRRPQARPAAPPVAAPPSPPPPPHDNDHTAGDDVAW